MNRFAFFEHTNHLYCFKHNTKSFNNPYELLIMNE